MPSLNFKKQFAAEVAAGIKRQTIRAKRKIPIKPGDKLTLYTGQRTKSCEKLGDAVCTETKEIEIVSENDVILDGIKLSRGGIRRLANADGFVFTNKFIKFFEKTHGLPFNGDLIKYIKI
jgi:hypothetical protein